VRPTLLLASNSPRRRELLSEAGFEFEIFVAPVAESLEEHLTLRELTALNATRKALAAARIHPKRIVLAADTLVAIDNQVLGKPGDAGEAMAMIERLIGRDHEVCTSVFVCHLAGARSVSFSEISRVHFRNLNRSQIERYLSKVNPLDKAGAYAAQGFGSEIIERIDGSFTNVVGLPMEKTIPALGEFGIVPNLEKS